jgi:hypothetical protein
MVKNPLIRKDARARPDHTSSRACVVASRFIFDEARRAMVNAGLRRGVRIARRKAL